MDRNRDGRRGNMAAMNGLSRRRPRSGSLRDSPEEDGGTSEMQESTRLRDRGGKKDRDRDRSSRSKRRRGDRMLHGSNREEGEDSTDESMDEEEDEDDDDTGAAVRLPPPPSLPPNPSPQSSTLPANHSHRKSLLTKVIRPPPVWKVADEMIGVSVPRKARSASAKRSHDCWLSGSSGGGGGGGGGGSGEQMHRQPSTSPSRPSQAAAAPAPISPSSSNPSVRKKTKQICGTKHRPPKISKSSSSIQEIEFEVAEVLYGLTRQFQASPKQDAQMPDSKDANGSCTEIKSRASSPNSLSPLPAISQSPALPRQNFNPLPIVAPKRKRPRPVKFEDENPTSPSDHSVLSSVPVSSTSKTADVELPKMDAPSPKSEKTASTPAENGVRSLDLCSHPAGEASSVVHEESKKPEISTASDVKLTMPESDRYDRGETAEEPTEPAEEPAPVESDINDVSAAAVKTAPAAECPREKFEIDLMAPPPGKSSPERDSDFSMGEKCDALTVEIGPEIEPLKTDGERCDSTTKSETRREVWREEDDDKGSREELDMETPIKKETSLYLQLEIDKYDKEGIIDAIKQPALRQQPKVTRAESKQDRPAQAGSLPLPVPVAGWPGGLPFGYMGQVPSLQAVVPMDGSPVAPKALQPQNYLSQQLRPKRCATHCHIAQNIYYHQQLARINPFWSAAAGSSPFYGAKPYNLNVVPTADSAMLSNPLQAGFPVRGLAALQDKVAPIVGSFSHHPSKEKASPANFIDAAQRKQLVLQQPPLQAGSASNMLPAPAFIFPLNQPPAAVAASRTPHVKFTGMNVASSSNCSGAPAVGSGSASTSVPAVNFSYANLPQAEAQYLLLQNHGYPFPIPTHVGAPPYRGANHTQAMPFFSNSMYASQMLHPSQHQPQPPQQGPQNASTSTGSSSSQKHPQHSRKSPGANASGTDVPPNRPCTSKQRQHLPSHQQARQLEGETASEDSPSTADSRISQPQKGMYNHNFVMPLNPPNFALMSSAAAALNSGVNQNDKLQQHPPPPPHQQQHPQQNMKVELAPSQSFAMSFAAFAGSAASGHHGLDFSAAAQNHAIFQSLPDMARHGYQLSAPAAAAQSAQHKKAQQQLPPEGGKFLGEPPMNAVVVSHSGEDERKAMLAGKAPSGISQHSLSFSRPDSDPSGSAILGNNVIDGNNARTLNLIPAPVVNGGQAHSRPTSATPASAAASSPSGGALNAQQQQQLSQLQKKQQQQMMQQMQQQQQQQLAPRAKPAGSSNNVTVYNDRLPVGAAMPKFPNLAGFPQALIHASNPTQSPQWKNSARNSTSVQSPPNPSPPVKTHLPQQQSRTPQPTNSNVGLHSQISFGMASMKSSSAGQQQSLSGANSIQTSVSVSVAATTSVGSPPTSVSKGGGGSPRAPSVSKTPSAAPPTMSKSSAAGLSQKSSPVSNRSVPSILGQPHIVACPSSVAKSQQQHQQQQHQQQQLHLQKQQQQFPAAQLFFANSYLPAQSPHSNAAASATPGYHQRRPSEQQQQQQQPPHPSSPSVSTGAAVTSVKGLPSPSLLQAAQFAAASHAASGTSHTLMSAAGFPYSHAMPSVSVKPVEQKPAAGSDALHAYWQPEKR